MHVGCAAINDVCENALPIGCGDTLFGNTENANPDSYPSCGTSFSSANGVWYQTTGTGGEMTASTCNPGSNYDTKLFLFEGTCGGLVCIDGNDDDFGCGFSIRRSTITWDSDEGTTYFLLVNGFGSADGNFELSLECEDIEEPCVSDGVYDDVCDADCLEIDVPESFDNTGATVQAGEPSPGAGTGASSCNSQDGWCSFETDVDNSIWFQFVAPASGCVNVGAVDADLQIAVWQATDCGDFGTFTEIGANDDGGPGLAPLLENLAVNPGETYWVQIDGFNGATEDDGTVLVSECTVDSFCDGAVELFCGDTVTGSTVGEPTHDLDFCGTSLTSSGGVWFTFTGVGDVVTLTTCNPGTNYDTKLGVFTGDCTSTGLVCIGGNDDGSPDGTNPDPACVVPETGSTFNRASTVSFTALAGVDYFIYVTGFSTNEGTFELSVDCMNPLLDNPSGLVEDNSTVRLDASKFAGSEELAISNFYPNPAEFGATNIDIYSPVDGIARIQLFDNIGRLAHNVEVELYNGVNTVALSLGDLPIGAYFANITIGDYAERKKLIIAQ